MDLLTAEKFILEKLQNELPAQLSYHSVEHTKDVYQAVQTLAAAENITADALTLLLTAALFHDSGFLITQHEHERSSCVLSRQFLPEYGYSPAQIDIVCGMIMATRIPQGPTNLLEQILCDADLDYLGRDDFFTTGRKLYTEFSSLGIVSTEEDWNQLQAGFLEKHHYFTKTAIRLRKAQKEKHLNLIRSKLG